MEISRDREKPFSANGSEGLEPEVWVFSPKDIVTVLLGARIGNSSSTGNRNDRIA